VISAHPGHVVDAVSAGTVVLRVILLVGTAVLAGTAVTSRRLWTLPLLSAPVLIALVGTRGWFAVLVVAHVVAASVWLGAVLRVLASAKARRQVAGLAVSSALVVAATGTVMALADRVRVDGLLFDRLVLGKAGLLLLAAALGWGSGYGRGKGRRTAAARPLAELTALTAAAALGASLLFVPLAPAAGRPVVTGLVAVVPQRPGPNLVHLATDDPVTVNGIRSQALAGSTGQWVGLELPAGRSTLDLGPLGTTVVDTGHGPSRSVSGPECASALLQGARQCPDAQLVPSDARALAALGRWLNGRGTHYAVRGDTTARSEQAARLLPSQARPTAVVLTGGWDSAARELARIGRTAPAGGVYLAPWLLNGTLLSRYAVAGPYVVLPFDPKALPAQEYLVQTSFPSAAGYRAWGGPEQAPELWATTPASIFPTSLDHGHASAAGWFPGGSLVPVADLHSDGSEEQGPGVSMQ
jgi:hypothetical protein